MEWLYVNSGHSQNILNKHNFSINNVFNIYIWFYMEQESVTLIIIISTIVVLVFTIAMIVLFSIFQHLKNKLLIDNKTLREIIKNKLSSFDI